MKKEKIAALINSHYEEQKFYKNVIDIKLATLIDDLKLATTRHEKLADSVMTLASKVDILEYKVNNPSKYQVGKKIGNCIITKKDVESSAFSCLSGSRYYWVYTIVDTSSGYESKLSHNEIGELINKNKKH